MSSKPQTMFRGDMASRQTEVVPIDRRLRITAPHEWLIVVGLVVAVLGTAIWGLAARVDERLELSGVIVRPELQSTAATADLMAEAYLDSRTAQRIEAGMEARVTLSSSDSGEESVLGRVESVTASPSRPSWLSEADAAAENGSHLLRVTLEGTSELVGTDAAASRIVVVLGRTSPMLLILGASVTGP